MNPEVVEVRAPLHRRREAGAGLAALALAARTRAR